MIIVTIWFSLQSENYKMAQCSFGEGMKTQNFNMYNIQTITSSPMN